jgi:hypothetical protein
MHGSTLFCYDHFGDYEEILQFKTIDKKSKGVIDKKSNLVQKAVKKFYYKCIPSSLGGFLLDFSCC